MGRWSGVLKVPVYPSSKSCYRVAASLCLSPTSKTLAVSYLTSNKTQLTILSNSSLQSIVINSSVSFNFSSLDSRFSTKVPAANAIFFSGDRVEGTGNPVIERLSDLQKIAELLVSKFGASINAWVIEASLFNGPFAVYNAFIPSVNQWGEPKSYSAVGFPASTSTVSLLSYCLEEAKNIISKRPKEPYPYSISTPCFDQPKTYILGFSKGGTVLNQLVTELGFSEVQSSGSPIQIEKEPMSEEFPKVREGAEFVPVTKESLLNSITEIHYVDVGLNSSGAYLTDHGVIKRIAKRLIQGTTRIRFVLHGTPRQWCDKRRFLIRNEKDELVHLLESEARRSEGKLQVCERFYFADRPPDMQMHFEIIESLDVS